MPEADGLDEGEAQLDMAQVPPSASASRPSQRLHDLVLNVQCVLIGIVAPAQLDAGGAAAAAAVTSHTFLQRALPVLNASQWLQTVETRHEHGRCGWPLCSAAPRAEEQRALWQRLSAAPPSAPALVLRHQFCSTVCETNARVLHRVLPVEPLWLRPEASLAQAALSQLSHSDKDDTPSLECQLRALGAVFPAAALPEPLLSSAGSPLSLVELTIVEHTTPSDTLSHHHHQQDAPSDAVDGYSPLHSLQHVSPHSNTGQQRTLHREDDADKAEEDEDDDDEEEDDRDLAALFSGQRPRIVVPVPTISDFGLVYATLDGWLTEPSRSFFRGESSSVAAEPHPRTTSMTKLPPIDGDVSSRARHVSVWALLVPHLSACLDAIVAYTLRHDVPDEPMYLERSSIVRDVQNLVVGGLSLEREPLPLRSRHWRVLAFLLLWAVTKTYHPRFHDRVDAVRAQELSWMTADQRAEMFRLLAS